MTAPAINASVRLSAAIWRCSGVGSGSASCNMPAIRPISVRIPVAVTTNSPTPRVTVVFMNTTVMRSPSGAAGSTCAVADFATGCASPVSEDSCTSSPVEVSSRPSAGMRSPACSSTTSPDTSSAASTFAARPSRRTVAVVTSIFFNASSDASARDSWTNPMIALSSTTSAMTTGVSHSRVTTRLTTAASTRMMISRSWNWRRNAFHRGSRRASASRFGPSRSCRRNTSDEDSPALGSTARCRPASAVETACQDSDIGSRSVIAPSCSTIPASGTGADSANGRMRSPEIPSRAGSGLCLLPEHPMAT